MLVGAVSVSSHPQNIDKIDTSQLPHQDINTLNCFDLVEKQRWPDILGLDQSTATLKVEVSEAGQPVVTCLSRQSVRYVVSVVGNTESQPYLLEDIHSWEGVGSDLVNQPPAFPYLIYGGQYRLQVTHCGIDSECSDGQNKETVFSDFITIQSSVDSWCSSDTFTGNSSLLSLDTPALSGNTAVFHFSFTPCSNVQLYDKANITLFSAKYPGQCGVTEGDSHKILTDVVSVFSNQQGEAAVMYQSPELPGDKYYCLSVSLSHISCRLVSVVTPNYCYIQSDAVWLPSAPVISFIIPFCTDHFACGWLYVVLGAGTSLLVSCVLAICCIRCCDRCCHGAQREESRKGDEVDFSGEVISLAPVHDKITWSELHKEWDTKEDKVRGKILLLYSPDTKLFKELQEAFKSFLDLACHCDIYDLFDDALFDTIALDPSEWLQEFVNDEDVKILVISSAGAHRRQLALKGEQPLNLPDNSLLDGLFTSGLRFVSNWSGLKGGGRVATARYEMLHITEESHKLGPPLSEPGVREFLVPTQLHELFCWVHHLKPLDLIGKPWANYHLEMQLLQDALKLVRRDRTVLASSGLHNQTQVSISHQPNYTDMGNGVTMI